MLTIIIPTLNAATALGETLASVRTAPPGEIIVVDGGSGDDTLSIAKAFGAHVIEARQGRGQQLAVGALASHGEWLLFLHADTRLADGWRSVVGAFMADPRNRRCAGYFRFALDDPARAARRIEAAVRWRNRALGLPYGDQGLLISRAFYEEVGGYRALPLMEDVNLVVRIGRRRLVELGAEAVTSAEKYRRDGYVRRPLRNLLCLALYGAGVPVRVIAGLYR